MIDFAWSEFLFIALLALILIGPKELPTALRYIGRIVGKARAFTKGFSSQLDLETHIGPKGDDQNAETSEGAKIVSLQPPRDQKP